MLHTHRLAISYGVAQERENAAICLALRQHRNETEQTVAPDPRYVLVKAKKHFQSKKTQLRSIRIEKEEEKRQKHVEMKKSLQSKNHEIFAFVFDFRKKCEGEVTRDSLFSILRRPVPSLDWTVRREIC